MGYTNGERTGLNKYETKVSQIITMKGSEVKNGVRKVGGGTGCDTIHLPQSSLRSNEILLLILCSLFEVSILFQH